MIDSTLGGCGVKYLSYVDQGDGSISIKDSQTLLSADNRYASSCLASLFNQLITKAQIKPYMLDQVYVCNGPGSMTGIKIALAFCYGLSAPYCFFNSLPSKICQYPQSTKKNTKWIGVSALSMIIANQLITDRIDDHTTKTTKMNQESFKNYGCFFLSGSLTGWYAWSSHKNDLNSYSGYLFNQKHLPKDNSYLINSINFKEFGTIYIFTVCVNLDHLALSINQIRDGSYKLSLETHKKDHRFSDLLSTQQIIKFWMGRKIYLIVQSPSGKFIESKITKINNPVNQTYCDLSQINSKKAVTKSLSSIEKLIINQYNISYCVNHHHHNNSSLNSTNHPPTPSYLKDHYAKKTKINSSL